MFFLGRDGSPSKVPSLGSYSGISLNPVASPSFDQTHKMNTADHRSPLMKAFLFTIVFSFLALSAEAQQTTSATSADPGVKGHFLVYIDDSIHLFLNGSQILGRENTWTSFETREVELKPGDRIVAAIKNSGGPRAFMLMFVTTDLQRAAYFTNTSFKILSPGSTDFSPGEFSSGRTARQEKKKRQDPFAFKTRSEWVWGDMEVCTLAATVTGDMFHPLQK
jgi:hypothetical protein